MATAREYMDRAGYLLIEAEEARSGSPLVAQTAAELAIANAMVSALLLIVAMAEGREVA
jgi:hypothetical protein